LIRLGVTGGIGSGKSTVAALLAKHTGSNVLDADAISRHATGAQGAAIPALVALLGEGILDETGALNRTVARQRAFAEPDFRAQLESIIHPVVRDEMARMELEAEHQRAPMLIYDIPLLVESGTWRARLSGVLVVDCSEDTQVARVEKRNQLAPHAIRAIIRAQASRTQRLTAADAVVCNDGISLQDLEKLTQQVSNILLLQKIAKDSA
jgi:dephospho-CoA kinase